jgi:hypothetical protein
VLSRIRVTVEKRLSSDQETRGADTTLERSVFEKLLLERMELICLRQTFNCLNVFALCLNPKDETRTGDPAIEDYAAGTAVTGETAFFGTGESKDIAQHFE